MFRKFRDAIKEYFVNFRKKKELKKKLDEIKHDDPFIYK